jgi:hypothetical protein
MRKEQFEMVTEWQEATFPNQPTMAKISHLATELSELVDDIEQDKPSKRLEFADCFILLFGAAKAEGLSYEDICNAIDEKHDINVSRFWSSPDDNGVIRHIE